MEIDSIEEALRDFDKKAKKEPSAVLEEFLCHVAKTGQTMVQWSQFKNYFLFKLEKVMDDFKASAPEQRGVANPNVESIPFEDMKERILKIVRAYNGIPFTIQRLCELLTEPRRNYTGTDKFLRGVEKNVMVVSCVHPTTEKNGCTSVSRMNGVMVPGTTQTFTDRKVNGPGTPRPLARPKVSLAHSVAANGLPDSTEHDGQSDSSEASPSGGSPENAGKNKHSDDEEDEDDDKELDAEHQEVKRLKFSKEEDEQETESSGASKEAEAMIQDEEEEEEDEEDDEQEKEEQEGDEHQLQETEGSEAASSTSAAADEQEPSSSTSAEGSEAPVQSEREVPCSSQGGGGDMDQTEQQAPAGEAEPDIDKAELEAASDSVSSSSSSSGGSSSSSREAAEATSDPSSSTIDPPTEAAMSSSSSDSGGAEEPMEQD